MGTPGSQGSGGCKSGWKGGSPLWHILPQSKLSRKQPTKHCSAMHLIPWLPIYPTWLTLFSRDKHNLIASLKINDCRVYVLSKRRFQADCAAAGCSFPRLFSSFLAFHWLFTPSTCSTPSPQQVTAGGYRGFTVDTLVWKMWFFLSNSI